MTQTSQKVAPSRVNYFSPSTEPCFGGNFLAQIIMSLKKSVLENSTLLIGEGF